MNAETVQRATLPSGTRIVMVEDDRLLADLLAQKLSSSPGVKLAHAFDGAEGLGLIKKERPDIVLLDLALPGMNGLDVLKAVKEDAAIKGIPVLVLSNFEREGDAEKVRALGAANYLVKATSSLDEIVAEIGKIIAAPKGGA